MSAPKITPIELRAMDEVGVASKPFLQGMLNRLAIGAIRYGRNDANYYERNDMIATASVRLQAATDTENRNFLTDAANFCLLGWLHMPEPPEGANSEDSPGVVASDGKIWGARGCFAAMNGLQVK